MTRGLGIGGGRIDHVRAAGQLGCRNTLLGLGEGGPIAVVLCVNEDTSTKVV